MSSIRSAASVAKKPAAQAGSVHKPMAKTVAVPAQLMTKVGKTIADGRVTDREAGYFREAVRADQLKPKDALQAARRGQVEVLSKYHVHVAVDGSVTGDRNRGGKVEQSLRHFRDTTSLILAQNVEFHEKAQQRVRTARTATGRAQAAKRLQVVDAAIERNRTTLRTLAVPRARALAKDPPGITQAALGSKIAQVAHRYVGVHETGYNAGPQINRWNREAGGYTGAAWCLAFATGVVEEAARDAGINPSRVLPPRGGARTTVFSGMDWAKQHGRWIPSSSKPSVGDIAVMSWSHAEVVAKVRGNSLTMIDGNSGSGSAEVEVDQYHHRDGRILGYIDVTPK
jgi:hypothetical protein